MLLLLLMLTDPVDKVLSNESFRFSFFNEHLGICVTIIVCMLARVVSLLNERVKCLTTLRIAPQSFAFL